MEMKKTLLWHRQTCSILDLLCLLRKVPFGSVLRERDTGCSQREQSRSQVPPVSSCKGNWQQGEVCFATLQLSSWPLCRETKGSIWPSVYSTGSVPGKDEKSPHTVRKFIKEVSFKKLETVSLSWATTVPMLQIIRSTTKDGTEFAFLFILPFRLVVLYPANGQFTSSCKVTKSGFANWDYFSIIFIIHQAAHDVPCEKVRLWKS